MPTLYAGMLGLGDGIYSRPFVKAAVNRGEDIWLQTPWPQLYMDLPVHCVKPIGTRLRTQAKNETAAAGMFEQAPGDARPFLWTYTGKTGSVSEALERGLPLRGEPLVMDLPSFEEFERKELRGYVVVRPVTVRAEWRADSRNCEPDYIRKLAKLIRRDYQVVVIADVSAREEWVVGDPPRGDVMLMHGELDVCSLLALIRGAAAVIGPVGWIVPAALAYQTPLFCVLGGQGGHNHPDRLVDKRLNSSRIGWGIPNNFCMCSAPYHQCDKTISTIEEQFNGWRARTGV